MKLVQHSIVTLAALWQATGILADSIVPYERLAKNDSALLIVDLQVGLAAAVRDWDATIFKNSVLAHAAIGRVYDIPVVMTTSVEFGPNGPLPKETLEMYPNQTPIKRPGEVNSWDSPGTHPRTLVLDQFRAAVKATGKHQLIIAGITTDVCVAFLALSLRAEGYHVVVNLEASGTFNQRVADAALARMQAAGVQVMNFFSINGELFRDWRFTNPSADQTVLFLDHYLAEESWIVRLHAAAVTNGSLVGAGELETITVRSNDTEVFINT
ncbi:hypothetical protein LTR12_003558 [Friedmanniomyces endolithicus]|nr:hypothetical protein LTR74_005395 [Friedmanniomyces endolithicus]KAK1822034.1 hypothetical protein LTR12_003558 [Friedmanniomyces endolithicus]